MATRASFGDIIGIGFNVISKRQKIFAMWDRISAVIQDVLELYPDMKGLVSELAPQLMPQAQARLTQVQASAQSTTSTTPFDVRWLQQSLNAIDDAGLDVDGDYGELTRAAVRTYQTRHGLEPDGWAGADTSARLYDDLAKLPPSSPGRTPV